MLGRLVIAVLVICSAAAVYWHRQKTEAADIGEAVAKNKAAESDGRAAAAEQRAKEAEARAQQAEAKAAFFEAEIARLSASEDDPVTAERSLHVVAFSYRGMHPDVHKKIAPRFEVTMLGDPGDITRIRLFASHMGQPLWHETWDTENKEAWAMNVVHGGVPVVDEHAPSVMRTTRAGTTILALEPSMQNGVVVIPGMSYTVEVTADGHTTSSSVTVERQDP